MRLKYFFYVLCFISFFYHNCYCDDLILTEIKKLETIVNNKSSAINSKEKEIATVVLAMMDYDKFFEYIAGKDLWKSIDNETKSKIITRNNKKYVQDYFTKISSCKTFSINEVLSTSQSKKRMFSYNCDGENKNLDLVMRNNKVLNIQVEGVSFINIEKTRLDNAKNDEEKKQMLLRE